MLWITASLSVALLVLYSISIVIYRLFFHPLRRFPGPKLAAASHWYEFYYDILRGPGGTFIYEVNRMHEQYGPIIRINPSEIHVKDADWLEKLYTNSSEGIRNKYPPAAHMAGVPLSIFGTLEQSIHRRRRSALSTFFSKRAISSQEEMVRAKVNDLITGIQLDIKATGAADLRLHYLALATDVVCGHCFDYSMDLLQDKGRAQGWSNTIKAIAILTPLVKQFTWIIPLAKKLPIKCFEAVKLPSLARILALFKRMRLEAEAAILAEQHSNESLPDPLQTKKSHNNIFRTILSSGLPGPDKQAARIAQEGFVVIAAGSDTTSRVLTNATYHVLANKSRLLPRLQQELVEAMPDFDSQPSLKTLESLEFLTSIIKEALRITAVLTSRLPVIAPVESLQYGDWSIPPGTPTSMTLRDVLLDPVIFPEPHSFRPERWLDSNSDLESINRYFVPFSRGGRMCIGVNMAWAELYLTLAAVFRRLELELFQTEFERDVKIVRDCFIGEVSWETKGVRVTTG